MAHPVEKLIAAADAAIVREDFDALLDLYAEDAVLLVKPGLHATCKACAGYLAHPRCSPRRMRPLGHLSLSDPCACRELHPQEDP